MKITVISDTHMPNRARNLPTQVITSIEKSDALIHAGDFISMDLLYYFESLSPYFEGVAGNNDGIEIISHLGKKKIIEINGYSIGLIHGDSIHSNALQRAKQTFSKEKVDIVIFGHSHIPYKELEDGVLYFNPGSPTDKRTCQKYSYGEIELGEKIKADIFYFD